jgi:hypothetical protein
MIKELQWKGMENLTYEHCTVLFTPGTIMVQSKIEGPVNNVHTIIEYVLQLDTRWNIRSLQVSSNSAQTIQFTQNKQGEWADASRRVQHVLDGCTAIDMSLTPFTNTLPIKQHCFKNGESREFQILYIDLSLFEVKPVQQRYTYLGHDRFRYEGLDTGYKNEITFTREGFVQSYPNLFELV